MVSIGFIDNIVYDFHRKRLTPSWEIEQMIKDMSFKEIQSIIFWYNKARKDGVNSVAHLKLMYCAIDIIKAHLTPTSNLLELTYTKRYL